MNEPHPICPHFHRAVELVGRRWTGAIIFALLRGRTRFAGLRAAIPEITDRMARRPVQRSHKKLPLAGPLRALRGSV